nr:peptidylprolyl isomerase [Clostridia bacterium]
MEKILAKVGPLTVKESEVEEFLLSLGQRGAAYNNPEGRRVILEQIISNKLLLLEARSNLYETEPEFKAELARLKENLLVNYASGKVFDRVTVTEGELRDYYEKSLDRLGGGATVNASHILVDTEEQALEILGKIKSGELSFEDAAMQFSSCPSGERGGNLGDFSEGQMVPEFDRAVFSMEVGEITEVPVRTQFGYHLIKLNSKNEAQVPSFEEIEPQLREALLNEKRHEAYGRHINQLKILYPVEIV